jgi:hypothetical protein
MVKKAMRTLQALNLRRRRLAQSNYSIQMRCEASAKQRSTPVIPPADTPSHHTLLKRGQESAFRAMRNSSVRAPFSSPQAGSAQEQLL